MPRNEGETSHQTALAGQRVGETNIIASYGIVGKAAARLIT